CREGLNVVFNNRGADLPGRPHHVVEKNLSLLEPLGIPRPEALRFPLPERREEGEAAEAYLREAGLKGEGGEGPLLVIHPGAGWATKRWDAGRYAHLGDAWAGMTGGAVLLTWGPGEEEEARRVAGAMNSPARVAPPTGIRALAALLRRSDVFAGGDTGPLHLAAALGTPCLAVMGPTDPVRNGPWGAGHAVLHHRLACSGCYGRTCPDVECLERLEAPAAARALARLWETHAKS
ncbi:MAG: glycosyltransferase family 9 protein, partial [bacterium]